MNKSESIAKLANALCQFQAEVSNPKNTASNPFFKNKYAPLNDVLNLVRPILSKHGLSVLQSPSGDGDKVIITTILMHSSGEWIESEPLVLKAEKATAQGAGSAITYGRRYAVSAILGISSEDDDDGNHATGHKESGKPSETKGGGTEVNYLGEVGFNDPIPEELTCHDCGAKITKAVETFSVRTFKKPLCRECQGKLKAQGAK